MRSNLIKKLRTNTLIAFGKSKQKRKNNLRFPYFYIINVYSHLLVAQEVSLLPLAANSKPLITFTRKRLKTSIFYSLCIYVYTFTLAKPFKGYKNGYSNHNPKHI